MLGHSATKKCAAPLDAVRIDSAIRFPFSRNSKREHSSENNAFRNPEYALEQTNMSDVAVANRTYDSIHGEEP
jgi:hypothetical protein